jgi:integrase
MTKSLTDAVIRHVQPPENGRLELADAGCRGLWLRITSNGAKTFAFRFRSNGRSERLSLGRYPDLSLRDARNRADALRRDVVDGKNPSAHKRSAPARNFGALADRYLIEHARRFKRSADADERNLRLHVRPHWAHRDATKIERADVIELIERIMAADKPVLANRVQALVSSVFSFAVDAALAKSNPCVRLRKRGQETARTRTLTDGEIRLFWDRIVASPVSRPVGIALRLILLLGARPGEAAGMARSELEFDDDDRPVAWTIPVERSKNRRAHYLPLPVLARDLIGEALVLAGKDSAFTFPSRRGDGAIAIEGHALAVAMRRFAASLPAKKPETKSWRADVPSAHDLRRTAATRLSAAGVPAEDIAAILNHARGDITGKHYDQYQRAAEKRRALDRWALILAGILEPKPANVVALRG